MERIRTLQNHHVFSGFNLELLPPIEKKLFDEAGQIIRYKKNEFVYEEGSRLKGVYLILKGMAKMSQTNSEGTEQILFFIAAGELFGYRALLGDMNHTRSVKCLENCEIKFIDSNTFLKLLDSSKTLTRMLLKQVCHEFTLLANQNLIYAQKGIRERMAFALLVLNEKFKLPNSITEVSNIRITRTNLAAFIGTSIDVVSRNIKYFSKLKIIRTHGKSIFIIDFDYLLKVTGVPY